jgi:transposase InsO family protein/transposase-like protein
VKKTDKVKPKKSAKGRRSRRFFPTEYKLKAVQMHVDDGVSVRVICEQMGCKPAALKNWIWLFRKKGPAGLEGRVVHRLPAAVKEQIIAMKRADPGHGTHRISNFLKRMFFMKASHETVRRVLRKEELLPVRRKPKKRAVVRRTKQEIEEGKSYVTGPHLMWQSDISVFIWRKQIIYLIGFIDDFSRFITGLGLYMAQKAENVLEVFRLAALTYPAPKEMLTDNGRQYTSWRGKSEFEKEMTRAQIRHIRSRPHHPQTLGKIERFWKTIKEEFLSQALFENFDDFQERTRLWIQYYNFRRPHQGIGGLCPADKFYEMTQNIRQVMEKGIAENIQQMALLGIPRKPCYLVGRMDNQSVTVLTEKGHLKLQVSDLEAKTRQEMVYPLPLRNGKNNIIEGEGAHGTFEREDEKQALRIELGVGNGPLPCGVVGMDGKAVSLGGVQGTGDKMDDTSLLAEACDGRDAAGAGASSEPGEGACAEPETASSAGHAGEGVDAAGTCGKTVQPSGATAGGGDKPIIEAGACGGGKRETSDQGGVNDRPSSGRACPDNPGGAERQNDGRGGSESALGLTEDLLPLGEKGTPGLGGCGGERDVGPSGGTGGPGEGGPEEGSGPAETGVVRGPGEPPCPAGAGCVRGAA